MFSVQEGKMFYTGCHLSSVKGFENMGREALSIGASTFQFFTRNPRGGKAKAIDEDDVRRFLELASENGFGKLVAHAPYTLNPCSGTDRVRAFAYEAMSDDMRRMEYIPGNYYNFHPGSHVGQGVEKGTELIVDLLNRIITPEQSTVILLETMSGKGSEIGRSFEELARIYEGVHKKERLRVCFDTCHVNDAGYDLVHDYEGVFQHFDEVLGLGQIAVFHINDSMNPCGTHKDRHANIGKGYLGEEVLKKLVHDPRFEEIPKILETPWLCEEGSDKKTIPPYKEEIRQLLG